jgi:hypothetical protein
MQYDFVTETTLVSGTFAQRGYKVLILPQAWALSDAAAAAIRRFTERGGTVVADIRPAHYDERGRQRAAAALDDLFGVKGGFAPAREAELKIAGEMGLSKLELVRPGTGHDRPVRIESRMTVAAGRALGRAGDAPVCIVNPVGKGQAVLLNFTPYSSFVVRDDTRGLAGTAPLTEMPQDAALFYLSLFHAAGVERAFNFAPYKQEKKPCFPNVRVQRWKSGDYRIVAFFRQTDTEVRRGSLIPDIAGRPVSPQRQASGRPFAPLPWVYDIKNRLIVGQANWFIVPITPGSPALYAFLPGPLPALALDVPKQAKRGTPLTVRIGLPDSRGLHAIKVRAVSPDGRRASFWDQSILVGKEPKAIALPLAWNDLSGEWRLTFSDLLGSDTEQTVTVKVE